MSRDSKHDYDIKNRVFNAFEFYLDRVFENLQSTCMTPFFLQKYGI